MTSAHQITIHVTPLPHLIAWEMRDTERRLGHGSVPADSWAEIRNIQLRAGVANVEVAAPLEGFTAGLLAVAANFNWRIAT
jgi:hypothetical protein